MPDPPSRDRARRTVDDMDNRDEVRDFLTTRRERLTPEQAGVPFFGGKRRVKGLRREEVAMLAGMSTDYYTRLERGNLTGVSHPVLESLARALQLDEAERAHLFDLADTANSSEQAAAGRRGARRAAPAYARECSASSIPSMHRPTPATHAWTSWPPTGSAMPCSPTPTATAVASTSPGICSSTRARKIGRASCRERV